MIAGPKARSRAMRGNDARDLQQYVAADIFAAMQGL
jgi:hypothetical protein